MDIATGLAAAKTGLDLIKRVRDSLKREKVDPEEISTRLVELQELLFQAREALGDAQEDNRQLQHQIEEQERLSNLAADMEYVEDGGFFIKKSEKAAGKTIAYCPLCWKAAKADVPLNPQSGRGHFLCNIHHSTYETAAYREYVKRAFRQ